MRKTASQQHGGQGSPPSAVGLLYPTATSSGGRLPSCGACNAKTADVSHKAYGMVGIDPLIALLEGLSKANHSCQSHSGTAYCNQNTMVSHLVATITLTWFPHELHSLEKGSAVKVATPYWEKSIGIAVQITVLSNMTTYPRCCHTIVERRYCYSLESLGIQTVTKAPSKSSKFLSPKSNIDRR